MLAQTNCLERLTCTLAALGMAHTRERKRQLNVFQDGLMRNEVIALGHKTDAVVTIGVPIAIVKILGRNTVDQQVARVKVVEPADNVEHRGLTRTRGTQDGHELVIAKRQAYVVERHLRKRLRNVPFANSFELQHGRQPLPRERTRPLSPAVRIRRVCPTLSPFFTDTSEECREPRQKTNGTAPKKRGPKWGLYMVELILKGSGLLRTAVHDHRYALRVFYCSLFAIAWSISLLSAARCSAELMAPTMGSPTMLPF